MKSFISLIQHDTVVCIYIFIQLRKHYVSALSSHQKRKFEIPILCMRNITKGTKMGEKNNKLIIWESIFLSNSLQVSGDRNLIRCTLVPGLWVCKRSLCETVKKHEV